MEPVAGASVTAIAAASWFFERALGWSNPITPVVEGVASHAFWLLGALIVLSFGARFAAKSKDGRLLGMPRAG